MRKDISILLVEDDGVTNFLNTKVLNECGIHNIKVAENGEIAVSYISKTCPQIILLDLNMPVMDGWEFLEYVDNEKHCPNTSIVILSSSIRARDKEKSMVYGMTLDYLEKPLTRDKVEQVFSGIVE